jgi:hypothetical protein
MEFIEDFWPLLCIVALIVLLLVIKRFSPGNKLSRRKKWFILLLTALVSFFLSISSGSRQESDFYNRLDLISLTLDSNKPSSYDSLFKNYYNDNFIFLENIYSRDSIEGHTRRDILAAALKQLRKSEKDIDLIVLDMIFQERNDPFDGELQEQLLFFAKENKLVLAKDTAVNYYPIIGGAELHASLDEVYGDVAYPKKGGITISQHLFQTANSHLLRKASLPFLAFKKLNKEAITTADNIGNFVYDHSSDHIYQNHFVPPHIIIDSTIRGLFSESELEKNTDITFYLDPRYTDLHNCLDSAASAEIALLLSKRKKRNESIANTLNRNIIIIGSVQDPEDMHYTPYGILPGVELIINSIVYMQLDLLKNHLSNLSLFLVGLIMVTFIYSGLKVYSEEYIKPEKGNRFFNSFRYVTIKCMDELFLTFMIIVWVYATKESLFTTNILFPYFCILSVTKALMIADKT